jgi:hypothetical protein
MILFSWKVCFTRRKHFLAGGANVFPPGHNLDRNHHLAGRKGIKIRIAIMSRIFSNALDTEGIFIVILI